MNEARLLLSVVVLACVIVVSVVGFRYLQPPFFWIGCGYLIILLGLLFASKSSTRKAVLINLGAVLATLTGYEWYLYSSPSYEEGSIENVYDREYTIDHPDLGYTLGKNLNRPNATKYLDGELIYRVAYTSNEHGLRTSMSGDRAEGHFGCILLYGGSYAYGEGLNDAETLPWQIDVQSGRRHRVFNLGLHGYGPHHMLASLESGHADSDFKALSWVREKAL